MTDTLPVTLNRLEPGQRRVMHVAAIVPSILLAAGGYGLGMVLNDNLGWPWWPSFVIVGLIAIWSVVVAPRRRWQAWGWALSDDELHVGWGVWTQVHTIVPLARVQHIDVSQGPLERTFGVARLIVHTAGTAHATVVLPGITRATAEGLRDTIRQHIRSDPW